MTIGIKKSRLVNNEHFLNKSAKSGELTVNYTKESKVKFTDLSKQFFAWKQSSAIPTISSILTLVLNMGHKKQLAIQTAGN